MDIWLDMLMAFAMAVGGQDADIVFAGDAMMHTGQLEAAKDGNGYSYDYCFSEIAPYIRQADYAVVNLETPLGHSNFSGYPQFNAPVSYVEALSDAGFDMFLTANNHTLDRRDKGLKTTVAILDSLGYDHIGTYANAADRRSKIPCVVDVKGFRVGFVNYTYGTNGFTVSSDAVVDYIDASKIHNDIEATRKAGAEIIVAAMHWGAEYTLTPVYDELKWAKVLEKEGVDIIMGSHPHVVQPMELRENRTTGRPLFLAYSHGNFISNMNTDDTRGGLLTRVTLSRDERGAAYVKDAAYKLIFVEPPTARRFAPPLTKGTASVKQRYGFQRPNYRLLPVDSVESSWRREARLFATSARRAFAKGNVGAVKEE